MSTSVNPVETPHGIELFHKDGTGTGIFYCSQCRIVHKTKEESDACHGPRICSCGNPITSRYRSTCDPCDSKEWRERMVCEEFARYEKATKIPEAEWTGDQVFWGDQYYESVDDAVEAAESDGGWTPEYVWAARNQGIPKASLDDLIERVLEGMWEDADREDLNGVEALESAVEIFNLANESVVVYMVDHSTAILVAPREQEAGELPA